MPRGCVRSLKGNPQIAVMICFLDCCLVSCALLNLNLDSGQNFTWFACDGGNFRSSFIVAMMMPQVSDDTMMHHLIILNGGWGNGELIFFSFIIYVIMFLIQVP